MKKKKRFKVIISKKSKFIEPLSKEVLMHRFIKILDEAEKLRMLADVKLGLSIMEDLINERIEHRLSLKSSLRVIKGNFRVIG